MKSSSARSFFLLALAGLLGRAASAQVLVHDYVFQNNLNDSVGSIALTNNGGVVGAGSLTFGPNQGPTLLAEGGLKDNYSIGIRFSLSDLSGYKKILDFSGLTLDSGFYNLNGNLDFYPATAGAATFAANQTVDVVLTRNSSTGLLTGYLNGAAQFSFIDSTGLAIASLTGGLSTFNFFRDDTATGLREASGGVVNEIRVWDSALGSASIADAFAPITTSPPGLVAVPEPSTYALAGMAALGLIVWQRRRAAK
jgi:hypothetical protein